MDMELPVEIWQQICHQAKQTNNDIINETDIDTLRDISQKINHRIHLHDEILIKQLRGGDIVSIPSKPEYAGCLFQVQNIVRIYGVWDKNIYIQQIVPDANGHIDGKYEWYGCGFDILVHLLKIEISSDEQFKKLIEYISKLKIGDNVRYFNRIAFVSGTIEKIYSKHIITSSGERVPKPYLVIM